MSAEAQNEEERIFRPDLADVVTAKIREMILRGRLAPGERLVESSLAATFGTSRGPVRDALARLEAGGLVTISPRRGASVTRFTSDDVEEVYSLRAALETLAITRAATRATDDDLRELASALDELSRALDERDTRAAAAADMRFHRTIVEAARHRRLRSAWEVFADQTLVLLQVLSQIWPDVQAAPGGHAEILDCLRRGEGEKAADLLRSHLSSARDGMLEHFDAKASPATDGD